MGSLVEGEGVAAAPPAPVAPSRPERASAPKITEAEFQEQVLQVAHAYGWRHLHVRRSIGKGRKWVTSTNVPWPDLTLWRPGGLHQQRGPAFLVRELKVVDVWQDGQKEVLAELAGAGVDAGVWWPADFDNGRIVAELSRRAA